MIRSRLFLKFVNHRLRYQHYSSVSQRKRICIVGSGPAGFYTSQILLKSKLVEVDVYEKLPVPFGLIRYGVAPDHPEIKNATKSFHNIADSEFFNFYGNINVGQDVSVSELLNAYHAVVLAYGAEKDRELGVPGEETKNVLSAREFVSWYNGHPHFVNINLNLDTEVSVVVGHGNVALDVGRILLQEIDVLKKTDIAEHALEKLKKSKIKKVVIVGRRGPLQVSFTVKELREMTKMAKCDHLMHSEDFTGVADLIPSIERPRRRLTELMCNTANEESLQGHAKLWELKFYRNPKTIIANSKGNVEKFIFGINKLKELDITKPLELIDTGKEEIINCGLVLKSIGYKSCPIDSLVPFDEKRCIIPNKKGKVLNAKGLYCSGWIKTGPKGVLLPTMYSSFETAEEIINDIRRGELEMNPVMSRTDFNNLLKQKNIGYTTFEDWKTISKLEEQNGQIKGKPREKFCNSEEILKIVNKA